MNNTIKLVQDWAKERGIDKADPSKQLLKLGEEYGELIADFIKGRNDSMRLEIGDMLVVLHAALPPGLQVEQALGRVQSRAVAASAQTGAQLRFL